MFKTVTSQRPGFTLKERTSGKREITSLDQFCPTTSMARLSTLCARNTPRMMYPHFFPLHCRRHSKPRFLGQPYSSRSGKESLSDRRAFSSAIICGPIKALSLEKQGPNSTTSLRTTHRLFLQKEKEELSLCGSYFFGTFQCVEAARKRTLSQGYKQGQTLFHKGLSHTFGTMLEPSRPQAEDQFHNKSRANGQP